MHECTEHEIHVRKTLLKIRAERKENDKKGNLYITCRGGFRGGGALGAEAPLS